MEFEGEVEFVDEKPSGSSKRKRLRKVQNSSSAETNDNEEQSSDVEIIEVKKRTTSSSYSSPFLHRSSTSSLLSGGNTPAKNAFFELMKNSASSSSSPSSQDSSSRNKNSHSTKHKEQPPKEGGSRYRECPQCGKQVFILLLQSHLDTECTAKSGREKPDAPTAPIVIDDPPPNPEPKPMKMVNLSPQPASAFGSPKKKKHKSDAAGAPTESFHLCLYKNRWYWKWTTIKGNSETSNYAKDKMEEDNTNKELNEIVWSSSFKVKDPKDHTDVTVSLTTNHNKENKTINWNDPNLNINKSPPNTFPPSVLKSVIQKNVRLCRPVAAVRAALALIKLNFQQFIRRLSIIMIEDAILHPSLPLVVWLTVAASDNSFVPSEQHIDTCLKIAWELASVNVRDPFFTQDATLENTDSTALVNPSKVKASKEVPSLAEMNELDPLECCLVKSIFTRSSFGGMKGDVSMLKNYVRIWYNRFKFNTPPPPNFKPSEDKSSLPHSPWLAYLCQLYASVQVSLSHKHIDALTFDDVPLSAIDFHCSSMVCDFVDIPDRCQIEALQNNTSCKAIISRFMQKTYGDSSDSVSKLKAMIWLHRSSVNKKELVFDVVDAKENAEKQQLLELFNQLKAYLDDFSTNYIERRLHPDTY